MSLRRFVALIALVAAIGLWHAGRTQFSDSFVGVLALLIAPIVGFLALAVLVFDLRTFSPRYEDSGFGLLSERQGINVGTFVLFLLGAVLLLIGFRGLYLGRMPTLGHGPDLVFATAPFGYLMAFAAWVSAGAGTLCLAWLARRSALAKH